MRLIRGASEATSLPEEIRFLVQQRIEMLSEEDTYDPDVHGYFIVVEPHDTVAGLDEQLGFHVLCNRFDGARFGDPAFRPSFEFIEEHATCFEMVFVLSDDGFGVEIFLPKACSLDPDLLAMCRQYAIPSQEPT